MHVLMLGWEFPPFITGGLGTACYGLTRALDQRGIGVTFVLPRSVATEHAAHVDLVSPEAPSAPGEPARAPRRKRGRRSGTTRRPGRPGGAAGDGSVAAGDEFEHLRLLPVEAEFQHPYPTGDAGPGPVGAWSTTPGAPGSPAGRGAPGADPAGADAGDRPPRMPREAPRAQEYEGDLLDQVHRYADFCFEAVEDLDFDVIHAHDWMTYPAGLWIARVTGRPLVVHVHSTEFDRSGEHVDQRVYDIERRGMHAAMRVVTVSQLTRNVVVERYAVPPARVEVVYNGVELDERRFGITGIRSRDKIVLYFGRITFQKGPEYFVRAAKRVLEVMDDVKFVVAGSGDMARHMIEMAANLGIGHKVLFTGFLRGDDIPKVFSLADLYVMPSVSEPFGIAPLEAMGHDVPVLISRSSGVSEVLTHALKVDFWDVDDMATKIIAVLRHPPLSQTLKHHGAMEARRLTWAGAAERCEQIYRAVIGELTHTVSRG